MSYPSTFSSSKMVCFRSILASWSALISSPFFCFVSSSSICLRSLFRFFTCFCFSSGESALRSSLFASSGCLASALILAAFRPATTAETGDCTTEMYRNVFQIDLHDGYLHEISSTISFSASFASAFLRALAARFLAFFFAAEEVLRMRTKDYWMVLFDCSGGSSVKPLEAATGLYSTYASAARA